MITKKYVAVVARFSLEGELTPLSVEWEDGRQFEIDRVVDIRRAASLKAGGMGWRFTVRIRRQETYLYYDLCERKWFVEAKE